MIKVEDLKGIIGVKPASVRTMPEVVSAACAVAEVEEPGSSLRDSAGKRP